MRGLDPRIHGVGHGTERRLDRRVKPGDDNCGRAAPLVRQLLIMIPMEPDSGVLDAAVTNIANLPVMGVVDAAAARRRNSVKRDHQ